jgi:hypothetical protein
VATVAAARRWSDQTDGVVPVTVGTVLWGIALVVTFLARGRLAESGSQWWVWTCATGLGLGLFGCWWVRRRRAAIAARAAAAEPGA